MDARKLHAPRRPAVSRDPLAFALDRSARDGALRGSWVFRWRSLSRGRAGIENLCLQLVLLPFWTSFLVRTYAWLFILRDTGLINTVLQRLHLIAAPLPLLYNDGAVLTGLVYNFLPFFVLPMYATLERLDPALLEAAADLGARPLATLLARDSAALRARHRGRLGAGLHPLPRRLSDAGPAGRREVGDAGQSGAEPVHHGARLAVRFRGSLVLMAVSALLLACR